MPPKKLKIMRRYFNPVYQLNPNNERPRESSEHDETPTSDNDTSTTADGSEAGGGEHVAASKVNIDKTGPDVFGKTTSERQFQQKWLAIYK